MKNIVCLILCLSIIISSHAQKEDYIWIVGYGGTNSTAFGNTRIDFNFEPPEVYYEDTPINFFLTDASICDKEGSLLFYTEGVNVGNRNNEIMENGDSLGLDPYHLSWGEFSGLPIPQASLILKVPNQDSIYMIIHGEATSEGDLPAVAGIHRYYYSTININVNNGLGAVVNKNELLFDNDHILEYGKLTATRHANGRDWWFLFGGWNSNIFHTFLLSPAGITDQFTQMVGDSVVSGGGQAVFSPDGSKYAFFGALYFDQPGQLNIYDFDRCTGILSNPSYFSIDGSFGGLAFSQNSRFLYQSREYRLIQLDMWADDIPASADTIANNDGFIDPIIGTPTTFGAAQLAPNGKIYIATTGNTRFMHIINDPDEQGADCDVVQHGLELAALNDWSIPNYPNFRLHALPGSPCDTLRPIVAFSYDSMAMFTFMDESERIPTEWHWSFGDGGTSTEQNPTHTYMEDGEYEVCLVATNEAGSDTTCQTIQVVITSTNDLNIAGFEVFPNPVKEELTILLPNNKKRKINVWNLLEQSVFNGILEAERAQILVKDWEKGMYFLEVEGLGTTRVLVE